MKLVSEKMPDLNALYVKELRVFLSAEEMISIKAPRMAETAQDPELIHLFRQHIEETEVHVDRLRAILRRMTGEADPLKCKVVYSLFDEVEDLIEDASHLPVRDAALVTEAQRVQHYELAGLGALREIADALELREDAQLLDQSLRELESTNLHLTALGERLYPAARKIAYTNVQS
ncbi:MAG TPA: ferritin-like domain-containing protein [Terracidiphilus sp.]